MYSLKFENENGEIITLSGVENLYQIVNIEGLNPPNGNIRRTEVSGMDGTKYMSAKLEERNIVLTVRINGNVEKNRLNLYNWFKSKHWCKMTYSNGSRDVSIEGYVETVECDLFTMSEQMQISIVCPDPYFQSAEDIITDISLIIGKFTFPFAFGADGVIEDTITDEAIEFSTYDLNRITNVVNDGEDDTGLIITITANDAVLNPVIYNVVSREFFRINTSMVKNDVITINTNKGHKSVTLLRQASISNLINKVDRGSTWFSLVVGDNQFTYEAHSGTEDMRVLFTHRTKYQAV